MSKRCYTRAIMKFLIVTILVAIQTPVAAGPPKDGWDKFYICLTAALVAIAAVTLGAIWYQAVKTRDAAEATKISAEATKASAEAAQKSVEILERQTAATETAANAALTNAKAVLNIERAWLDIILRQETPAIYTWQVTNYGRTIAMIKEFCLIPKFSPLSQTIPEPGELRPFDSKKVIRRSKLLVPNIPWAALPLNLAGELPDATYQKIRSKQMGLSCYGIVRYDDVSGNPHESIFCYYYNASAGYECLVPVEAPEYNLHT